MTRRIPHYADSSVTLWHGDTLDVLTQLPDQFVNCCVTSPPYYGLRDYGQPGQYGLEPSPAEYVQRMVGVFGQVRRVLADDGTLWLNLGDSYSSKTKGSGGQNNSTLNNPTPNQPSRFAPRTFGTDRPDKNLLGIPWRVAFALQDDGWILRNAIIWNKPNAMPESVTDRLSCRYEHVFLFSKSRRYWFDLDPIRESTQGRVSGNRNPQKYADATGRVHPGQRFGGNPGSTLHSGAHQNRNPGDVWTIPTSPFPGAHFAVMPPALAERCIQAGCKADGTVLDPFSGSGTTGAAATKHGRRYVGIDLSADYLNLSLRTRLAQGGLDFGTGA